MSKQVFNQSLNSNIGKKFKEIGQKVFAYIYIYMHKLVQKKKKKRFQFTITFFFLKENKCTKSRLV